MCSSKQPHNVTRNNTDPASSATGSWPIKLISKLLANKSVQFWRTDTSLTYTIKCIYLFPLPFILLQTYLLWTLLPKMSDFHCLHVYKKTERTVWVYKLERTQAVTQRSKQNTQCIYSWLRACLHGGGGPQIGEVTCSGSPHLSCKRDQIKMRDYMDRRVTPPKRVTSPTWGPTPPCKQALRL